MKVFLTGFDPFGGEKINPAFEAVKRVPDTIDGHQIIKREIPTVFGKSIDILAREIKAENPDVVICVGQAGGRFNITPEIVAINKSAARIPDNEGNQPADDLIFEDGETAYFTTLPYKAIVQALHDNEIPAQLSYTAGTYVCNHIFYGLMYHINRSFPNIRGGFIHVPYISQQVLSKKNTPSMSLTDLIKSLEVIIKATLDNPIDIVASIGETH